MFYIFNFLKGCGARKEIYGLAYFPTVNRQTSPARGNNVGQKDMYEQKEITNFLEKRLPDRR